jgi:hypothetical protein
LRVIWVLDNVTGRSTFYGKLYTLILATSISQWKKFYPDDTCVLYCDELTRETLRTANILHLWDNIIEYRPMYKINRTIFWAAAKLEVLSLQKEPVIIVDNDLHIYKPIKDYLDPNTYYVHNIEQGKGYYPSYVDKFVRKLSYKPRWQTESVNVSFLKLPSVQFALEYAFGSLKLMEEFTEMEVPNAQYLIFAEQLFLRHMFDMKNIDFKALVGTYWNCDKWEWGAEHDRGIWSIYESELFVKHYGPLKRWIVHSKADQDYGVETKHLTNCINLPTLNLNHIEQP